MGDALGQGRSPGGLAARAVAVAESDPAAALALAAECDGAIGAPGDDLLAAGTAAWARGMALAQLGRRRPAAETLEAAVALLGGAGDVRAAARASVSLAFQHIGAGRFDDAVALLQEAAPLLVGAEAARAEFQLALALQRAGRVADAVETWDRVVKALSAADLPVLAAKARHNRGLVHAYRGELAEAEADLVAAGQSYMAEGEAIRAAEVLHNLGFVALRGGDLPRALRLFDEAQSRLRQLGVLRPEALVDRVEAALDAGLVTEGRPLAQAAVAALEEQGFEADVPEACLLAARACEEDGDPAAALAWATRAQRLFEAQGRPRWQLLAASAALRAEAAMEPRQPGVADRLVQLGRELRQAGWRGPALAIEVRAASLLVEADRLEEAGALLVGLASERRGAPALDRLQVWLIEARYRQAGGDREGAQRALAAAHRALLGYLATLGSVELRSRGAGRAQEVMALGVALAAEAGRPERALRWVEAVRSAQDLVPGRTADDPETADALQALRRVADDLDREPLGDREAARLRREQAALEEVVRRRSRHAPGPGRPAVSPATLEVLAPALGHRALVEYALVGDRLLAVVLEDGRPRLVDVAAAADVRQAVAYLRLALRTALLGDREPGPPPALVEAGHTLDRIVARPLGLGSSRGLVVVAAGPIASVPWSLLPSLEDLELVVSTSATAWLRARAGSGLGSLDGGARVLVVAGPRLLHADDEADAIAEAWSGKATVLRGERATVGAVLAGLQSADVVHVAAHGSFRGDNPLLSAICLHDGPLTGYELARSTGGPTLLVLSSCEAGMVDADSAGALGLSGLLAGAGVATTIASVSPVSDASSAGLMVPLHRALREGTPPARALSLARRSVGGVAGSASSAGFVCFGYG